MMKEMDMRFATRIYEYFMSPEDALYDNEESTIENRLTSELDELQIFIEEFNIGEFPKVKRFGLPIFEIDMLK